VSDSVRWLLVGAGDVARKRVAAALASAPCSHLAAVCDLRADAAEALAREYNAQPFSNLDAALERADVNAVYIATPVALHVRHGLRALQAGKHILVEKPLGLDGAEALELAAAAARWPVRAGCAYFRRLFPAFEHTARMLAQGELGRIVTARLVYQSWFDPRGDDPKAWRVERARAGGGPLADMGSHMFDVLIGLLGMPLAVSARCDALLHPWDVEDTASIVMTLPGGAHVTASITWCARAWRHEFEIVGSEASLCWQPYDSGHLIKAVRGQVETLDLPPAANVHLPLVADFVEAIRTSRAPVCPLAEAAKTNLLLDAIYRSAQEHREVAPTDTLPG